MIVTGLPKRSWAYFGQNQTSAARAYAVKYGSALCRWSSTEAVAEALGGSAPVWLGLIDYGGADSQTAIPGLGSFHGLPLALFSSESSYSACADLSSAGAQALSAQLKQALAGFMTSGSPGWDVWTPHIIFYPRISASVRIFCKSMELTRGCGKK